MMLSSKYVQKVHLNFITMIMTDLSLARPRHRKDHVLGKYQDANEAMSLFVRPRLIEPILGETVFDHMNFTRDEELQDIGQMFLVKYGTTCSWDDPPHFVTVETSRTHNPNTRSDTWSADSRLITEVVDMPLCQDPNQQLFCYRLKSFLVFTGSKQSGHWSCYAHAPH